MTFNAKLHIQGVGCFKPDEQNQKLLVIFPDGTRTRKTGLCFHLSYVQFRVDYLTPHPPGTGGYVTRFLNRELLTIHTGGAGGMTWPPDLKHLPHMTDVVPDRPELHEIDPLLLDPLRADDRVIGKLLINSGKVEKHADTERFESAWFFNDPDRPQLLSSVTTVTYEAIEKFRLNFRTLGPDDLPQTEIDLTPDGNGELDVWVRNMCDGFPPEETRGFNIEAEPEDRDFRLNYTLRSAQSLAALPMNLPTPKLVEDEVSTVGRKCMGSV